MVVQCECFNPACQETFDPDKFKIIDQCTTEASIVLVRNNVTRSFCVYCAESRLKSGFYKET